MSRPNRVEVYKTDIKVKKPCIVKRKGGGERKNIEFFSAASRRRLLFLCRNSGYKIKSQFVLTYHNLAPLDGALVKKQLNTFLVSLRKRYRGVGYIWVLEFQKRGAPHFHVVAHLGGAKCSVSFMRDFIKKSWAGVIKKNESKADDVRGLYGVGLAVAVYVSKYCGKNDSQNLRVPSGRCWGFWGRKFPAQRVQTWFVTLSDFRTFVRRVRRFCKKTSPFLRRVRENFRGRLYLPPEILYKLLSGLELRGVSA